MKYTTVVKSDSESKRVEEKIRNSISMEEDNKNPDYVIAIGKQCLKELPKK